VKIALLVSFARFGRLRFARLNLDSISFVVSVVKIEDGTL